MPKGIVLTPEEQNRRRYEIFNAALDTFLEKGFQETSMREIAALADMGKSSLYDYFKTKDEILVFIMQESLAKIVAKAEEINAQPIPADQRLRQILLMHLEYIVDNKKHFALFALEGRRMGKKSQKRVQKGRYVYQDMIGDIIDAGIKEGTFRQVDPLLTARLLINVLLPVVYTTRPTGTPQFMLEESLDIMLNGIQA